MSEREIARLARAQHALVTLEQALTAGLSMPAVKRRLRSGRWERVHDTVYAVAGAPTSYVQQLLAACLAIGAEAAVSHRAAAVLHGLLTYRAPLVEATTTRSRSPELTSVVVHRLDDLASRWVTAVEGVPCTTVARTLVDLGAVCQPATVEAALDRAVGRRMVVLREVREAMHAVARQGRRGVGTMRQLLAVRVDADRPAGVLEARMASLLATTTLPSPMQEYVVRDEPGGFIAIVDFAYPHRKLAIEVDGYEAHIGLTAFRRDRSRDRALQAVDWLTLHFTWSEVDTRAPHVIREIQREYRRRAP